MIWKKKASRNSSNYSLSLQAAWVVSVCLPSYLAPAKHPTFLTVVPLLPMVLLHHPLNNTLSLSKSVLLPHHWTPGRLLGLITPLDTSF